MGTSLKLRGWLSRRNELRLLMVGLDAAGKTTLLYQFKLGERVRVLPTIGFNVESFPHGETVTFTLWEVGGGDRIRALWHHYFVNTSAIIFVVNSNDRDRLHEARDALHKMRENPQVQHAPLLVLANKQDLDSAMSAAEIAVALDLHKISTRAVAVMPVTGAEGTGVPAALDWLTLQLTGRPVRRSHSSP